MNSPAFSDQRVEKALHEGEFCFYYQPKVSFLTGQIVGAEALLRWVGDNGALVPPGAFLPRAEETGFITDITAVMLPELVRDIESMRRVKPDVQVAFNVSAKDLVSPYLPKMLRAFIGARRVNPGNIQIEITETAVADGSERVCNCLLDLISLGIEIVMDDYGTGYSSLDVLSRMPFSALKLDQGVVGRMSRNAKNTHIVRASLYLARELGIKTIAEGVEDHATYQFLVAAGCNEVQGFYISPGVPLAEFTTLLESGRTWPCSPIGRLYDAWTGNASYRRKVLDAVHTLVNTRGDQRKTLPLLDLVHNAAHSGLGRWYSAEGRAMGDATDAERLSEPHRKMYEAGRTLVEVARDTPGSEAFHRALHEFLHASSRVDAEVHRIVELWYAQSVNGET